MSFNGETESERGQMTSVKLPGKTVTDLGLESGSLDS